MTKVLAIYSTFEEGFEDLKEHYKGHNNIRGNLLECILAGGLLSSNPNYKYKDEKWALVERDKVASFSTQNMLHYIPYSKMCQEYSRKSRRAR
jgi:hypothetical protein